MCEQLERFVAEHGRLPTRRDATEDATTSWLIDWIRYQRRSADRLSTYQRARLALIPGWSFSPRHDSWADSLHDYEIFVRDLGRVPRRSAPDRSERRLALWHRNQKIRVAEGRDCDHRADLFRQLNLRVADLLGRN